MFMSSPPPASAAAKLEKSKSSKNLAAALGDDDGLGLTPRELQTAPDKYMRGIAHGPEEVQARMTLLFITNLDALNQTFTVKILIDAKWKCPEADFDEASRRIGILDVSWVPTWAPILSVDGTVEENVLSSIFFVEANEGEQLSSSTAKASGDGGSAAGAGWFGSNAVVDDAEDLWIRARFVRQLVVIDRLNLRAFPFDVQDCDVTLVGINVKTLVALADGDDTSCIGTAACLDPAGMAIMTDFQLYRPMPAIYRLVSGEAAGATAHGAASAGADGKPITEGSRGEKGAGETAPPGRVLRRQGHVREYANVLLARFARQFDGELESGGDKAELRVVVFYRRNWHAYVYDTYLLLFLIGSSALASWGIHCISPQLRRDSPPRVGRLQAGALVLPPAGRVPHAP